MKNTFKKTLSLLLCFAMLFTVLQGTMLGASAKVVGPDSKIELTITTDKSTYSWGDTVIFNITVKNVTNDVLNGIKIDSFARMCNKMAPQGDLPIISRLSPGESQTVQLEYRTTKSVGLAAIFFPIIWLFNPAERIAYRENNFNYEYKVKVGAFKYRVGFEVEYVPTSDISLTIEQDDFSTTEKDVTISGSYSTSGVLKDITYEVYSYTDTDTASETGSVIIDMDKWEVALRMKPDLNKIIIRGENLDGVIAEKKISVTFDAGNLYTPQEEHIMLDSESETLYVNNMIIVVFNSDVSKSQVEEIVNSINGKIVGQLNGINQYQIEVSDKSLQELNSLVSDLERCDEVLFAHFDEVYEDPSMSVAPNDPWEKDNDTEDWLDTDIDGSNYWLEMIEAPAAWAYNSRLSKIKIGIVDSGFDTDHEDLTLQFPDNDCKSRCINKNSKGDHGTHVSGIIGATANNGKGITGIVWNKDLICSDWKPTTWQSISYSLLLGKNWSTTSFIYAGLALNVEAGAKVVNFSLGYVEEEGSPEELYESGHTASGYMAALLRDYDFIVVQAAGNNGVDAVNSGFFASITPSNCVDYFENFPTFPWEETFVQKIMKRVFVVGAAERNGTSYRLAEFSNWGAQVNIAAPGGEEMYSTLVEGYGTGYGTSMAAPIVTGVCSLVWAVNPKFTGAEVADIVLKNTSSFPVAEFPRPHVITGDNTFYHMVNAKLAVEAAIRKTDASGIITGTFVDATTGDVINDVSLKLISYTGFGKPPFIENKDYPITGGNFSQELPAGSYRFKVKAEGYVEKYVNFDVTANETTALGKITMSTALNGQKIRIVLRWGMNPADLDAHFVGTIAESNTKYHVYFGDTGNPDKAYLDIDDMFYEGPETITLDLSQFSEFIFFVHNFSHGWATSTSEEALSLAKSGATVEVYAGESLIASYAVPTNRKGTTWSVFKMNSAGVIEDINSFSYDGYAENSGM